MDLKDRIFVALDVDKELFYQLLSQLKSPTHYKIGFPLFLKIGLSGVQKLKEAGKKLFLDFKLFDIPNTMTETSKSLIEMGADFFTVHLSSGKEHLKHVVETVRDKSDGNVKILGVSVLTSFSRENLNEINIDSDIEMHVVKLAEIGKQAGIDGIVSSPQELRLLRKNFGDDYIYVTPGIRPSWSARDDQKRVMGFREAIREGATYTVIGRPITQASDPESAFQKIITEG